MTENNYITTKEAAEILGLSSRRVSGLCVGGALEGARKSGRDWSIPEDAVYAYLKKSAPKEVKGVLLPCAAGGTSYENIVRNNYYVDKTLLVRDLIDDQIPVVLFARPRRFGKTLALDMLKCFFEKSEKDNSVLFKDKLVWSAGEKYRRQQGVFPVVSLSFKDAKYSDWENTYASLKENIRDEYLRHPELFSSIALNDVEHAYLEDMKAGTLTEVQSARSLLNLVRMLEKHHKSKVVVLIDEYDTPIQQGHSMGYYDEVITFMRNFLSGGLKDNSSVAYGVLTGILRVSKENLFSGLNNLVVNTVLDDKYSGYFGFTRDEVKAMAAYYGHEDKLDVLMEWYDGYRFGNKEIFNPWSVSNYFFFGAVEGPYWTNTSDNVIIKEVLAKLTPEMAEDLCSLMNGETVDTSLSLDVIYPRITDGTDTIFSFLLLAGYLKIVGDVQVTEFGTFAELALPNKEIKRVYSTEVLSWLKERVEVNVVSDLEKALRMNDSAKLKACLRKYMMTCISSFDGAVEGFYHGLMLGLVAGMSSKFFIRSNRESGEGRFDLMMEPKCKGLPGIIMEFKRADSEDKLEKSAQEALAQIEDKKYGVELAERGVGDISRYGIAFFGKKVELATL